MIRHSDAADTGSPVVSIACASCRALVPVGPSCPHCGAPTGQVTGAVSPPEPDSEGPEGDVVQPEDATIVMPPVPIRTAELDLTEIEQAAAVVPAELAPPASAETAPSEAARPTPPEPAPPGSARVPVPVPAPIPDASTLPPPAVQPTPLFDGSSAAYGDTTASPGSSASRGAAAYRRTAAVLGGAAVLVVVGTVAVAGLLSGSGSDPAPSASGATGTSGVTPVDPADVRVRASSTQHRDGSVTYVPGNTLDGRPQTAWNSDGQGVGAMLTYTFVQPVALRSVTVLNGYQKALRSSKGTVDLFALNERVRTFSVVTDTGRVVWNLRDDRAPQTLTHDFGRTRTVRLEVTAVYPSTQYRDLAVSEVRFGAAG